MADAAAKALGKRVAQFASAPPFVALGIILLWIGGLLFLGISALLAQSVFQIRRPSIPVHAVIGPRETAA